MRKCFFECVGCLLGLLILSSCGRDYPGYQRTEDGLYYRFIECDSMRPSPVPGDFLKLRMDYFLNDSLLYTSAAKEEFPRIQLKEPEFKGDILSGLAMMHEGDSASFIVRADSAWFSLYDGSPSNFAIRRKDKMRFEIRLEQIQSREDFLAEVETVYESMKTKSEQEFQTYLSENQINTIPTENGVYYWTTQPGKGVRPKVGDLVEVCYSGRFLNGEVFDSIYLADSTFSFILGKGYMIPAWEEVVPKMQQGERATMLVPYQMAYGDRSVGKIPPYANLIYDIEIRNILDSEVVEQQYEERLKSLKSQSESDFKAYLEEHHIVEKPSATGLYIIPHKKGNGRHAAKGMIARIKYEARTLGGALLGYAESPYQDVKLGDGTLMPGVEEGLLTMSEGDSVTLLLPYYLADGEQGNGSIAPYTNVVLGITLLQLLTDE